MRTLFSLVLVLSSITWSSAQIKTPQPSPSATLMQTVGLTNFEVKYSRPSMKGRKIFGDLVPFDVMWRTGANKNTTVSFDTDITIGDQSVSKGTYALFTKPSRGNWEIYLYKNTENWGTPEEWKDDMVKAKLSLAMKKTEGAVETFTISFDDITNNGAMLSISWENTLLSIPVGVPTKKAAMASIEKAFGEPTARDYYMAASYYMDEQMELKTAKEWIDKAVAMDTKEEMFWIWRKQALIHDALDLVKQL